MEDQVQRQRNDRSKVVDPPVGGGEGAEVDHAADDDDNADIHPLICLHEERNLLEEVGILLLLARCSPLHVDVEQVGKKSQGDVERDTSEEAGHERRPLEVLDQRSKKRPFARAITEKSESDLSENVEDDDQRHQDVPTGEVGA